MVLCGRSLVQAAALSLLLFMASARALLHELIARNKVMIFSKTYCPYCVNAKDLFDRLAVPYQSMELDVEPNGAELIKELIAASGQHTVPNIYINGQHVGGCSTVTKLYEEGKLLPMLNDAQPEEPAAAKKK